MKKIEMMNVYVSNLAVLNVKLHNLHWNVVGQQFMPIHLFTEELYDELFIKYDDAAERIKMLGHQPLASMKAYLEAATIEELPSKSYSEKEVLDHLKEDLNLLLKSSRELREIADQEDDFETVALLEGHIMDYSKKLWFVSTMSQ